MATMTPIRMPRAINAMKETMAARLSHREYWPFFLASK